VMPVPSQTHTLTVEPPRSISDQIYRFLKEQILSGKLPAGDRLLGKDIARQLNASRTPVREAFRSLEHDGLVERLPQGGVKVRSYTVEEVHQLFDVRGVLEAHAVQTACERITPRGIAELEHLKARAESVLNDSALGQEEKIGRLLELNTRFHDTIYHTTGNPHLVRIINELKSIVLRMRSLGLRESETWVEVWQEHGQLLEYLKVKDKSAAVALIRIHVTHAATHVIKASEKLAARGMKNAKE
jgi:DNA-binding GntR family transcriptional regulator